MVNSFFFVQVFFVVEIKCMLMKDFFYTKFNLIY